MRPFEELMEHLDGDEIAAWIIEALNEGQEDDEFVDACRVYMVLGLVAKGVDVELAFDTVDQVSDGGAVLNVSYKDGALRVSFRAAGADDETGDDE